jgi:copper chaperone CopZ
MTTSTGYTTTFTVTGMTCGHCVSSVTEELSALDTVTSVDVVLETGAVTVTSERELTSDEIATAVAEAGYQLAG